jgi:acetate kinase
VLAATTVERWDGAADSGDVEKFLAALPAAPDAVGHRVVHGGCASPSPVAVDDTIVAHDRGAHAARAAAPAALARRHRGPAGGAAGPAARRVLRHGVPRDDPAGRGDVRAAARVARALGPAPLRLPRPLPRVRIAARGGARPAGRRRVVTCHLGAGASLCAVLDGRSVDTTMGFTPLDGLVMATRSGSVDPGLLLWLQQQGDLSAADVQDGLEHHAGVLGLAGTGDFRDLLARRDEDAELAVGVYDAPARAGGRRDGRGARWPGCVGVHRRGREHAPDVRPGRGAAARVPRCRRRRLVAVEGDTDVTAAGAAVRTLVVTAREDVEIARARALPRRPRGLGDQQQEETPRRGRRSATR